MEKALKEHNGRRPMQEQKGKFYRKKMQSKIPA